MSVLRLLTGSVATTAMLFFCVQPSMRASEARAFLGRDGTVYSYGHNPGEQIDLGFPATEARRRVRASWCWLRVAPSEAYPSQPFKLWLSESVSLDFSPAALDTVAATCNDNVLQPARSQAWQDSGGAVYIPVTLGLTPGVVYTVEYPNQAYFRRRKVNECGYATIRQAVELGPGFFLPTTAGGSDYFAIADLPQGDRLFCDEGVELRSDRDSFPLLAQSSEPPAGMPGPGPGGGDPPLPPSPIPEGAIACRRLSPVTVIAAVTGNDNPYDLENNDRVIVRGVFSSLTPYGHQVVFLTSEVDIYRGDSVGRLAIAGSMTEGFSIGKWTNLPLCK